MSTITQKEIDSLNRIPIIEVAAKLGIEIIKSNKALCFIHNEKTPSLSFNKQKNYWHCFGCGEAGRVITLVMKFCNISFLDAVKWLGGDISIEKKFKPVEKEFITNDYLSPNPIIYSAFWKNCIENSPIVNDFYCNKKKIKETVINQMGLRLMLNAKEVSKKLQEQFPISDLINCGLFKERINHQTGEIFYSLFWYDDNTIIIPFFNEKNEITFLKGREILSNNKMHLNIGNVPTDIYNRLLLKKLKKGDLLYICEGESDTLSALSMGLNAIGLLGAHSFKKEYIYLLKEYQIIIVPDNDQAGVLMYKNIEQSFNSINKAIDIFYLTEDKDLNDYYVRKYFS